MDKFPGPNNLERTIFQILTSKKHEDDVERMTLY